MTFLLFLLACAKPLPLDNFGSVPDFVLVDQLGQPTTRAVFEGKTTVVDFFFTSCPDICPALSARMAEVQARYAKEPRVQLLSISVDPTTDTPPVLATYGQRFGADATRWHMLTGDAEAVKAVVVTGFKSIMQPDEGEKTVLHGSRFLIVDKTGTIRAYADPKIPGEVEATIDLLLATE